MEFIIPDWPAPANVRAVTSTRLGGVSLPPYDSLNLGDHVGDAPLAVAQNRRRLGDELGLPAEPRWLSQVHGTRCCDASLISAGIEADALFAARPGVVCAVLTADCLPLLLCDVAGERVAAVHAGWRGLLNGVIENSVRKMGAGGEVLAWLGPAIGPAAFEVGEEVRAAFVSHDAHAAEAFVAAGEGKWLADIYRLARQRLAASGIARVYGGELCTYADGERFYSYRRDGRTGRLASLIWMDNE
jgi:YfiH family protein